MNNQFLWPFPGTGVNGQPTYSFEMINPDNVKISEENGLQSQTTQSGKFVTTVAVLGQASFSLVLSYNGLRHPEKIAFLAFLDDYMAWSYQDSKIQFTDWMGRVWAVHIDVPTFQESLKGRLEGDIELYSFTLNLKGYPI